MKDNIIYIDSYVLQQDMRIRLPKSIISNMDVKKGETFFDIYLDKDEDCLILKKKKTEDAK
jgi:hypothetical protein